MRQVLATVLCLLLAFPASAPSQAQAPPPAGQAQPTTLPELLQQPYLWLFENAAELNVSRQAIEAQRKSLEQEKAQEKKKLVAQREQVKKEIQRAQDALKELNHQRETPETQKRRHDLHCRIQELRKQEGEISLAIEQGVNIKYDNLLAKLKVLGEWPAEQQRIIQNLQSGKAAQRKFGDFRDIGFRDGTFSGQADDIQSGREAIEEMRRNGLLPPEVEDEAVVNYVRNLARRIAQNSDLQVPLQVTVLKSEEINAFALPGGFLFVNTGLIMKADKESELAGVLAHEIAHAAARHGHRLMKRATIANLIYQAAQIAAIVLTGGVATIGTAYALQYGFFGLGLILSLDLLGVSREYEMEADILGTQYLWKAGYNTRGFVSFFDKMAQEQGYVTGLSWFRTHPPFYERMASTFSEITYLPRQDESVDDTSAFHEMQRKVAQIVLEMEKRDREAPTLKKVYECRDEEDHSGAMRKP